MDKPSLLSLTSALLSQPKSVTKSLADLEKVLAEVDKVLDQIRPIIQILAGIPFIGRYALVKKLVLLLAQLDAVLSKPTL
jgi:hypothetical protein